MLLTADCTVVLRDNRSRTRSGRLALTALRPTPRSPPFLSSLRPQSVRITFDIPAMRRGQGRLAPGCKTVFECLPGIRETAPRRQIPRDLSASRSAAPELDPDTDADAPSKHMRPRCRPRAITGMSEEGIGLYRQCIAARRLTEREKG